MKLRFHQSESSSYYSSTLVFLNCQLSLNNCHKLPLRYDHPLVGIEKLILCLFVHLSKKAHIQQMEVSFKNVANKKNIIRPIAGKPGLPPCV